MKKERVRAYSILLIYIVLVFLFHLLGYTGHFGYDDLHYAELANGLLQGTFSFEDHYAYRFPVVLFTAFSYRIFGISDLSSSLPAMAITIVLLFLVFRTLRAQGPKVLAIGLALTTLSNWFLFYSDKLMPDIYVALSVFWSLIIIDRYKYGKGTKRALRDGFLLALALLFGFMSKGTIVLMIPLLLFLLVSDLIRKRDLRFWSYSVASGVVLLGVYLSIIWIVAGDPMKRFEVIADNSYLNLCSYDQQPLRILLKRIFLGFFGLTVYQSLATGFIFVFALFLQRKSWHRFRLNDSFSFFLVSSVILFLSSSFMTISVHSYAPMCLDPRHYLFLVPVVAVPASRIIFNLLETRKSARQVILALSCVTILSFFLPGQTFWKLYLPLLGLFVFYFFAGRSGKHQSWFILLFTGILLLVPMDMIFYAQNVGYRQQREILIRQLLEKNRDCTVVTDEVQKRLLSYYSGFSADRTGRFLSFDEFEADPEVEGKKLLLLNGYTQYLSGLEESDLPYFARKVSPLNRLVFQSKQPDLAIYELENITVPGPSGTPLLSSHNDFETNVPFWSHRQEDISTRIYNSGSCSNRVSRYSSTFTYPLDSLHLNPTQNLLIQTGLFCYAEDETSASIVVSLENDAGSYFWKAVGIGRYIKAYANWWPVTVELDIPHREWRSRTILKVYVWNRDEQPVYIDNFTVRIFPVPD